MCGRFTQRYTWDEIEELYGLMGAASNLQAHYNIAPTDTVDVVRPARDGANRLVSMRWGLIPSWWKKTIKEVPATFNARADTVVDKPMFRDVFRRHRCIIPASGYYEWRKVPDGRQPYYFSAADGGVLSIAGLWDRWSNPATGEPVISCTMVITDANAFVRPIHDRMPVLLEPGDFATWLAGAAALNCFDRRRITRYACGPCHGGSTAPAAATTIRRSLMKWLPDPSLPPPHAGREEGANRNADRAALEC